MTDGNHNFEKEFKDLGKLASSVTDAHKKTLQWVQGMKEIGTALFLAFLGIFTAIPELFFHTTHGLRTLKSPALIFSMIAFGLITTMGFIPFIGDPEPRLAGLIAFITLFVYARRQSRATKRFRKGEIIHSKSTSDPYAFWYLIPGMSTQWRVLKIAEPLAFIIIGIAWRFLFGSSMGSYLMICGLAMHMKCRVIEEKLNNQIMDAIDQQVEANRLTEALESGKQSQDPSNGYVVPIRIPGRDAA